MANPSKAKGTKFENELLLKLRQVWPEADRAKANNKSNDLSDDGRWALITAHGDRRSATAPPTVMVLPLEFGINLLKEKYGLPENRPTAQA